MLPQATAPATAHQQPTACPRARSTLKCGRVTTPVLVGLGRGGGSAHLGLRPHPPAAVRSFNMAAGDANQTAQSIANMTKFVQAGDGRVLMHTLGACAKGGGQGRGGRDILMSACGVARMQWPCESVGIALCCRAVGHVWQGAGSMGSQQPSHEPHHSYARSCKAVHMA
jgi:hypothetical protein